MLNQRVNPGTAQQRAARFHAREARRDRAGLLNLNKTHWFRGASAMADASILTADAFPAASLAGPVTMHTKIQITENSGTHEGLVFEFGSATRGMALWVEDNLISVRAGGAPAGAEVALAAYDRGSELPVTWLVDLVVAANPGTGEVKLWGNGELLASDTASGGDFGSTGWSDSDAGSFASAPSGTVATDVPAGSRVAPDGFTVVEPLSVYVGQLPSFF